VTKTTLHRLGYRVDEWDRDVTNYLKELERSGKPVVLGGDLNTSHKPMDMYNIKNIRKEFVEVTLSLRESFIKMMDSGFIDTFRYFSFEFIDFYNTDYVLIGSSTQTCRNIQLGRHLKEGRRIKDSELTISLHPKAYLSM
jgi:hypothetical protein